jgi:hypothetical protein
MRAGQRLAGLENARSLVKPCAQGHLQLVDVSMFGLLSTRNAPAGSPFDVAV